MNDIDQQDTRQEASLSRPARCAVAALMLLGLCGGWLILLSGGFHHQLHRYTAETRFVGGLPALLMATILFALAAVAALALAHEHGARLFGQALACCAVLLPPALFLVIAGFGSFGT